MTQTMKTILVGGVLALLLWQPSSAQQPVTVSQSTASSLKGQMQILDSGGTAATDTTAHAVKVLVVDTSGTGVNPATDATHDSAVSATGPQMMLNAASDISGHTAVADGDAVRAAGDVTGRVISAGPCDRAARVRSVTTITDGSSTSAISAGGANVYLEIWSVIIANTSASAISVDLRDGTGGSVLATFPVPADFSGVVWSGQVPITGGANTAMAVDPSASATSIITTLVGCKVK